MKVIYYVAASLDGYIADEHGDVSWLERVSIDQTATGCEEFFADVDGLVMGRKTYDFIHDYGKWPYEEKPTWICSTRDIPPMRGCNLQDAREPVAAVRQARLIGVETLWVIGGGSIVGTLLSEGSLTHVSVSLMPILLGAGVKLVDTIPEHVYLRQESSVSRSGFTQIEYRVNADS